MDATDTHSIVIEDGKCLLSDEKLKEIADYEAGRRSGFRNGYADFLRLSSTNLKTPWRIDGVLAPGITLLVGPPGVGKSLAALSWAYHVFVGIPWFGRAVRPGQVIYLAPELSDVEHRRRLTACRAEFKRQPESHIGFWLRLNDCSPWILNQAAGDDGELDVDELIGLLQWKLAAPNGLLIIDPLAEHFKGDENSSKDMGAFVKALRTIRAALPGLDILVIHHTTKDGTDERGHTSLRGAVDLIWRLTPELVLESKKHRAEPLAPLRLEKKKVDLRQAFPGDIRDDTQQIAAYESSWVEQGMSLEMAHQMAREEFGRASIDPPDGPLESVVIVACSGAQRGAADDVQPLATLARFQEGATNTEWANACGLPPTSLRRKADKDWQEYVERRVDKKYVLTERGSALVAAAKETTTPPTTTP